MLPVAFLLVSCARGLHAQDLVHEWSGALPLDFFGTTASRGSDVDRDGIDDLVIGAPSASVTARHAGAVSVYSGRDGSLLHQWEGTGLDDLFGSSLAAPGDLDGDGYADLVVGAPGFAGSDDPGAVSVYSGATGNLLYMLAGEAPGNAFGIAVSRTQDIDGDGARDFWVGAYAPGLVYLYSGRSGTLLRRTAGSDATSGFGFALSTMDDLDGDGQDEVIIGAPFYTDAAGVLRGRVFVVSSGTGALLHTFTGDNTSSFQHDYFGWTVASVGDADHDGIDEILVGAWTHGSCQEGRVWDISGKSGTVRGFIDGSSCGDWVGFTLGGTADLDGDGAAEFLIGMPNHGTAQNGRVEIRSGATLAALASLDGTALERLGYFVGGLGDLESDGAPDLLIGALGPASSYAGVARLYSVRPPRVTGLVPERSLYDDTCPVVITGGSFHAGAGMQVTFAGVPATGVAVLDEATLTCTTPAGNPGFAGVQVSDVFGHAEAKQPFIRVPALEVTGDFRLGGNVRLTAYVTTGDSLLLLGGLPPKVTQDTPPFGGQLCIDPFFVLLVVANWPADRLDLDAKLPADPAFSGTTLLVQDLAGPKLGGANKEGAWSNCFELTIR